MHNFRLIKRASIAIVLTIQLLIGSLYFYNGGKSVNVQKNSSPEKVSFLSKSPDLTNAPRKQLTYHTISDQVTLHQINTRASYIDFNTSLCFVNGTDVRAMQKHGNSKWNCKCLPMWHGKDCAQPEVIWRALLAYRKPITINGPRKYQRRIIYMFEHDAYSESRTEIRINELKDIVDLFLIYDKTSQLIMKLNNGYLNSYHNKILYIKGSYMQESLNHLKNVISNLSDDDIVLLSEDNAIPNKFALIFLKFYDNWPEPLSFRLRWSVYGFFWIHPNKTRVKGFASTVRYLFETLHTNFNFITNKNMLNNSFTLGDLNHYGGWYCEWCNDPGEILKIIALDAQFTSLLDKSNRRIIESNYIEELIENGVYLDGVTNLIRGHRFNENYFAPAFVCDNSLQFDYLLINMYSKLDYYL